MKKNVGKEQVNLEDAFVMKGWIATDEGMWKQIKSMEALVTLHSDDEADSGLVYEFSIKAPHAIDWKSCQKVLCDLNELLPFAANDSTLVS